MINDKKIHMIGIGGISMSGIAEILLSFNCQITGYDATESNITKHLNEIGIPVNYETNLDNVKNADIVVYTAAIPQDNPELLYAQELSKELYERSDFLGMIMKLYKNVLCISGTHGKSTTTGMVSTIFMRANLNPTIMIGAMLPIIGGNNHVGDKEYFIAESCEYVDSFLSFFPTSEIILNVDNDHLDYFKNIDNIIKSFRKYTTLVPENGYIIMNNDDENTKKACDSCKYISYGINNDSNYMAKNISFDENGFGQYDLYKNGNYVTKIELSVRGNHNIYNSLAAYALSSQYISDSKIIVDALKEYAGVGRRFEYKGTYNNAKVYDDYAHHPSEIQTTFNSTKAVSKNKSIAVFQSHTYSRTAEHVEEFGKVLSQFDEIIIAPIYGAREINTFGISEDDIIKNINKYGNYNAKYIDSFDKIVAYLQDNVNENDLVITIGAGPINKVAEDLVKITKE